jgi:hypothetical protein
MPIKWLLKKITGRSSLAVKQATHQPTLDKDGYQLASGEPPLSPELEEAAKRAGALAFAVNQSMKAASVDTNPFRKQQSIKAARFIPHNNAGRRRSQALRRNARSESL